jgi:hypothetical protein
VLLWLCEREARYKNCVEGKTVLIRCWEAGISREGTGPEKIERSLGELLLHGLLRRLLEIRRQLTRW